MRISLIEPAAGQPRRRADRALAEHVPVRFPAATIEVVRELAETDGMTVSAWIRRAVEAAARGRTSALTGEHTGSNERPARGADESRASARSEVGRCRPSHRRCRSRADPAR
jgi:hypothetical protein